MSSFFLTNLHLSRRFDEKFFPSYSVDGNQSFLKYVRNVIPDGVRVVDVGAGKSPLFSPTEVVDRRLHVTGVDMDETELQCAPIGSYEHAVVADITKGGGDACADVVVAQSLLEHVVDGDLAAAGIASFAKHGAMIYTFCPNRRAWFARLNRLLPESLKRALLFRIYPHTEYKQGFPAHYSRCTPRELTQAFESVGVQVTEVRPFFVSSYFMFLFPLYLFWRFVNWPLMKLFPMTFCETFMLIGKRGEE